MQFFFIKFIKLKPVEVYQNEHNLILVHNTSKQFLLLLVNEKTIKV